MEKDKKNKKRKYAKSNNINLDEIPSSNLKMKYFKKKRAQKRLKNTISKTHTFIKIVSIIFLLWLSSRLMICHFWYLPQNTFETYPNIHLRIIGNTITPQDKIIASLKTIPIEKRPIYLINTVPYEEEIEKLSSVKKAFVRRYWLPARFEVTIEEEIPIITISPNPNAPEIAALTAEGKIITKDYLPFNASKYKTYKILTYDDFSTWTSKEILSLKILAQRIEDFSQEKLLYLDIRNQNDVYAQLETIKVRIGELNSTLKQRIERLSSIMPQIENLKNSTDYVDLRWDNTTYLKKKSHNKINTTPKENSLNKNEIHESNKVKIKTSNTQKTKEKILKKNKSDTNPDFGVPKSSTNNNKQEPPPIELNIEIVEP